MSTNSVLLLFYVESKDITFMRERERERQVLISKFPNESWAFGQPRTETVRLNYHLKHRKHAIRPERSN